MGTSIAYLTVFKHTIPADWNAGGTYIIRMLSVTGIAGAISPAVRAGMCTARATLLAQWTSDIYFAILMAGIEYAIVAVGTDVPDINLTIGTRATAWIV